MHGFVCNNPLKKYKPYLPIQGLVQTVDGDDKEIIVNGKAARVHCKLCRDNHVIHYC